MPSFTPTEQRLMDVLGDGHPHSMTELLRCLLDELGEANSVRIHIHNMRKKLRPVGHDIVCRRFRDGRDPLYYVVRLMASPYAG